jgi:hypothetical protein
MKKTIDDLLLELPGMENEIFGTVKEQKTKQELNKLERFKPGTSGQPQRGNRGH